jgi:hypothetical protein
MRRLALRWLLALALVVAQFGVHAHALSHLGAALHGQDSGFQVDHDRELCVAFDAVAAGAGASGDLPRAGPARCDVTAPGLADPLLRPLALTRFASRAPPLAS